MLFNFVEGRSTCGEDGAKPDEEENEHKRRTAANSADDLGFDIDNLRIFIMMLVVGRVVGSW